MKNTLTKNVLLLAIPLAMLATGCSKSGVSFQALRPADIDMNKQIKTLVVVNRTLPEKGWVSAGNVLEGLLSSEGIGQDRDGGRTSLATLSRQIADAPRFKVVNPGIELRTKRLIGMPPPLTWAIVDSIAGAHNAQGLLVLEYFDSDVTKFTKVDTVIEKTKEGVQIKRPVYTAVQNVRVKSGWRVYDAANKTISDEFHGVDEFNSDKSSKSAHKAAWQLPSARSTVEQAGSLAGFNYAAHISPTWVNVNRTYYKKGGKDARFKTAAISARSGDWKTAATQWKNIADTGKKKAAKRAAYNMIVACEKEGKLDLAMEWARKASTEFNAKDAGGYIGRLQKRINDENRVKMQLSEE